MTDTISLYSGYSLAYATGANAKQFSDMAVELKGAAVQQQAVLVRKCVEATPELADWFRRLSGRVLPK
jgi:hypothetical protein